MRISQILLKERNDHLHTQLWASTVRAHLSPWNVLQHHERCANVRTPCAWVKNQVVKKGIRSVWPGRCPFFGSICGRGLALLFLFFLCILQGTPLTSYRPFHHMALLVDSFNFLSEVVLVAL